jgi:hypothetical protein
LDAEVRNFFYRYGLKIVSAFEKGMKAVLLTFLLVLSIGAISQTAIPAPDGWKQQQSGSHYTYTPNSGLATNFAYELFPVEKNTGTELTDWLDKAAEKTIASEGFTIPASGKIERRDFQSIKIYGTIVKDRSGKPWNLFLMAYLKPDNTIRYARIIYPGSPKNDYLVTAANHFGALAKKEGTLAAGSNPSATDKKETDNNNKTTRTKTTTPLTAPGQGLKPAAIKGVVIHEESGIGVGGMVIIEYNPYLMLANGTVYRSPEVAPYDLDVAASKTAEPNKWGTWKLEGKTMIVTLPYKGVMKTERWNNWFWTKVPQPNEKLKGAFETIGGGGNTALGGNTMIMYSKTITFNDKGQFTTKKTSGGSNSDFDVNTTTYAKSNAAGIYRLDGYSIEMKYNNGEVVRKLFYFYPDSRTTFGIGGSAYIPDK